MCHYSNKVCAIKAIILISLHHNKFFTLILALFIKTLNKPSTIIFYILFALWQILNEIIKCIIVIKRVYIEIYLTKIYSNLELYVSFIIPVVELKVCDLIGILEMLNWQAFC
jgi:hypothetical protein